MQHSLEAEKTWLQCQYKRWGIRKYNWNETQNEGEEQGQEKGEQIDELKET